jgi:uncharacterized protein HemY
MTDFLKIVLLLVLLGAVAVIASVDAGHVAITWFNFQIETTAILLVIFMALVCFLSMGLMRLLLSLASVPQHVQHWREKRDWAKKEAALTAAPAEVVEPQVKAPKPKTRGKK